MPEYTVTFNATIVLVGKMTITADDEGDAERKATNISRSFNEDPPVYWHPHTSVEYKAEWEEDSMDFDVYELI